MSFQIDLSDRHALVCGASSGIGRAAATALAQAGATVSVLARRQGKLEELCDELSAHGARAAHPVVADMDDREGFRAALRRQASEHGTIHIAVHNTGGPASGPLLEKTGDDLLAVFRRHTLTAHTMVKELLPGMREAGYGRFVQVLSTSAREPIPNLGLSNVIRAGMAGWSKTLSDELPPAVTINNVLPGYTATERLEELKAAVGQRQGKDPGDVERDWVSGIPEGRLGEPREIGEAVLFLCSPMASYIRGQNLAVEGGRMRGL